MTGSKRDFSKLEPNTAGIAEVGPISDAISQLAKEKRTGRTPTLPDLQNVPTNPEFRSREEATIYLWALDCDDALERLGSGGIDEYLSEASAREDFDPEVHARKRVFKVHVLELLEPKQNFPDS